MKTVLILNSDGFYSSMFQNKGWNVKEYHHKHDFNTSELLTDIDLVCFTGGTDVNPFLYGQKRNLHTSHPDILRDNNEPLIFHEAIDRDIPMTGICRGSQFLCVMNGGSLFQHVTNHGQPHFMSTIDGEEIVVSSSHHQMMRPKHGKILGWCDPISNVYQTEKDEGEVRRLSIEPEAVLWKKSRCFVVQYHPEWMDDNSEAVEFYFKHLESIL